MKEYLLRALIAYIFSDTCDPIKISCCSRPHAIEAKAGRWKLSELAPERYSACQRGREPLVQMTPIDIGAAWARGALYFHSLPIVIYPPI